MKIGHNPTKLKPELQAEFIRLMETGCTITDICASVGISVALYYNWRSRGEMVQQDRQRLLESGYDKDDEEIIEMSKEIYLGFFEATNRALARANIGAVVAIRSAIAGQTETIDKVDKVVETRLRKKKITHPDGRVETFEEPYDFVKTTTSTITTKIPPDWRAGMEYLRRRSAKEWAGTQTSSEDFKGLLVEMVRSGELSFGDLEKEAGTELALEVFQIAGKQVLRLHD